MLNETNSTFLFQVQHSLAKEDSAKNESDDKVEVKNLDFHFMSNRDAKMKPKDCQRRYPCELCGKSFIRSDHLKNHKRTHTGERPFECDQCDRRFAKQFVMTRHKQNVHCSNSKLYVCEECGRTFARSDHLKTHLQIHKQGEMKHRDETVQIRSYSCDTCGRTYCRIDNLKKHQEKHKKPKQPEEAEKEADQSSLLDIPPFKSEHRHEADVKVEPADWKTTDVKLEEAENSDEDVNHKDNSRVEKSTASGCGKRRHVCEECGKDFVRSDHLKTHKRTHTGEKPFECITCKKAFCKSTDLTRHEETHLGIKRYTCQECGKAFSRRDNLKTHWKIHTGVKAFKCQQCEKPFRSSADLKRHCEIHSDVRRPKPFECNECRKCFTWMSQLLTHVRSHSGVKPFKCNECDKKFTRGDYLHLHEQTFHFGIRPFRCQKCDKPFNRSTDLKRHLDFHCGFASKPFHCEKCDKMFAYTSSLRAHMKLHSSEKRHICEICEKNFPSAFHLERHKGTHTYTCPESSDSFSHYGNVRRQGLVHKKSKINCDLCPASFFQKTGLIKHTKSKHLGDYFIGHIEGVVDPSQEFDEIVNTIPDFPSQSFSSTMIAATGILDPMSDNSNAVSA